MQRPKIPPTLSGPAGAGSRIKEEASKPNGHAATWRSLSGHCVPDFFAELRTLLCLDGRVLHVGTDSKQRSLHTDYVTAVAIVRPGHGGRIFYRRSRDRRSPSLSHKLFQETQLSLEVAQSLDRAGIKPVVVHVDANDDLRHLSSKYAGALAGMVVGFGFQVRVKPNSWCATHVADFVVNERNGYVA